MISCEFNTTFFSVVSLFGCQVDLETIFLYLPLKFASAHTKILYPLCLNQSMRFELEIPKYHQPIKLFYFLKQMEKESMFLLTIDSSQYSTSFETQYFCIEKWQS